MSLYRKTIARVALDALDRAEKNARTKRLKAEQEIVSEKQKKETEAYVKKHGIKNSKDWMEHIMKKILKTEGTGHLLSPLARNGMFKTNTQLETSQKKAPEPKRSIRPADHHTCKNCGRHMIREIISDTTTNIKKFIAWSDWVKCTNCDERKFSPLNQEVKI